MEQKTGAKDLQIVKTYLAQKLPARIKAPLEQPAQPREVWSMDFMSDSLTTGRRFRVLNIIDDYNRQALCTTPEFSMPSIRVVAHLKQAIEKYGKPIEIRVDNGPEFYLKSLYSSVRVNRFTSNTYNQESDHKMDMLNDSTKHLERVY